MPTGPRSRPAVEARRSLGIGKKQLLGRQAPPVEVWRGTYKEKNGKRWKKTEKDGKKQGGGGGLRRRTFTMEEDSYPCFTGVRLLIFILRKPTIHQRWSINGLSREFHNFVPPCERKARPPSIKWSQRCLATDHGMTVATEDRSKRLTWNSSCPGKWIDSNRPTSKKNLFSSFWKIFTASPLWSTLKPAWFFFTDPHLPSKPWPICTMLFDAFWSCPRAVPRKWVGETWWNRMASASLGLRMAPHGPATFQISSRPGPWSDRRRCMFGSPEGLSRLWPQTVGPVGP